MPPQNRGRVWWWLHRLKHRLGWAPCSLTHVGSPGQESLISQCVECGRERTILTRMVSYPWGSFPG